MQIYSKNHIKNDRPKLLLSVYHNHEDLYEIPRMINKIDKDYKYYLRQYQTRMCETTLYAI